MDGTAPPRREAPAAPSAPASGVVQVLICEPLPIVREALLAIFDTQPGTTVVGVTSDGVAALSLARSLTPDVVVVGDGDVGIDLALHLGTEHGEGRPWVLVFAQERDERSLFAALDAGVRGYLTKVAPRDELVRAVQAVGAGQAVLDPAATVIVLDVVRGRRRRPVELPPVVSQLSGREREVLRLAAAGLSAREVADQLRVSPATVRSHLSHLRRKLGLKDRMQLAAFALRWGLDGGEPPDLGTGVHAGCAGSVREAVRAHWLEPNTLST